MNSQVCLQNHMPLLTENNWQPRSVIITLCHLLCDFCVLNHKPCFQMSYNSNKLKCAECTCCGKSCVLLSWELLNMTQDNLHKDLAVDETKWDTLVEQLAELQTCVS